MDPSFYANLRRTIAQAQAAGQRGREAGALARAAGAQAQAEGEAIRVAAQSSGYSNYGSSQGLTSYYNANGGVVHNYSGNDTDMININGLTNYRDDQFVIYETSGSSNRGSDRALVHSEGSDEPEEVECPAYVDPLIREIWTEKSCQARKIAVKGKSVTGNLSQILIDALAERKEELEAAAVRAEEQACNSDAMSAQHGELIAGHNADQLKYQQSAEELEQEVSSQDALVENAKARSQEPGLSFAVVQVRREGVVRLQTWAKDLRGKAAVARNNATLAKQSAAGCHALTNSCVQRAKLTRSKAEGQRAQAEKLGLAIEAATAELAKLTAEAEQSEKARLAAETEKAKPVEEMSEKAKVQAHLDAQAAAEKAQTQAHLDAQAAIEKTQAAAKPVAATGGDDWASLLSQLDTASAEMSALVAKSDLEDAAAEAAAEEDPQAALERAAEDFRNASLAQEVSPSSPSLANASMEASEELLRLRRAMTSPPREIAIRHSDGSVTKVYAYFTQFTSASGARTQNF